MQRRTIQGFEYVNPYDDLVDFFPIKEATAADPLGKPDAGSLDCSPALPFPIPPGTPTNCSQNIGQIGARYAHHPSWHQPFLRSWMHVDKAVWNGLNAAQRAAVSRAARESVLESYSAAGWRFGNPLIPLPCVGRAARITCSDSSVRRRLPVAPSGCSAADP